MAGKKIDYVEGIHRTSGEKCCISIYRDLLSKDKANDLMKIHNMLTSLTHKSILRRLGAAEPTDSSMRFEIYAELMELGSLAFAMKEHNLTLEQKIRAAVQISMGMSYLHP